MREFERVFALTDETGIVDVGGTERNWHLIDTAPRVVLVNINGREYARGQFVSKRGDGTSLEWADGFFEIAYSNSVIEHMGTLERQQAFARELRRVGKGYYVQTPYKWFPVEPHLLCLCIHWLPKPIYRRLVRWFSVWGWVDRPSLGGVDEQLAEIRLLTVAEMRGLFPDGELVRERVFGITKSLIMMRR